MESILTKDQKRRFTREVDGIIYVAHVRYDDQCNNGHNTFAITMDIFEPIPQRGEPQKINSKGKTVWLNSGGCQHDEVSRVFPELAQFIKWHLCSSDAPLHYMANSQYWADPAKGNNMKYARSSAIWPHAKRNDIQSTSKMTARLPKLMGEFQTAMEKIGFIF